jgi:hypothetical protein
MSIGYGVRAAGSFGFDRNFLPVCEAVARVARRLWPVKTARNLASRAGTTHRAAEFWLSGQTGLNADALAELLRSDCGLAVLEELMGAAKPSWWPVFQERCRIAAVEARLAEIQTELERLR